MKTINTIISKIAKQHLHIQTLKTRKRDCLDFHNVAVWEVGDALEAAYRAGQASKTPQMIEAICDNLSPDAVGAIAARLHNTQTNDDNVNREVLWFTQQLIQALGGKEQQERVAKELGL